MITPSYPREETPEEAQRRFEIECEFVQSLANPHYLNYLAQRGYFKEQYFVNYLRYLLYFKRPEYARTLKFPQCLFMLEAVQHADFRDALALSTNAKYIEDQLLLQWHFYLRKRTRLFEYAQSEQYQQKRKEANKRSEETTGQRLNSGTANTANPNEAGQTSQIPTVPENDENERME